MNKRDLLLHIAARQEAILVTLNMMKEQLNILANKDFAKDIFKEEILKEVDRRFKKHV